METTLQMKKTFLALFLSLLMLPLFSTSASKQSLTEGTQSWDWSKRVTVVNHAGHLWDQAIKTQLANYHKAWPNMTFDYKNRGTSGNCKHVQNQITFCATHAGAPYYGATGFGGDGHEITWAIIVLPNLDKEGFTPDDPDVVNTVCHELAHAFGLRHNNKNPKSCINDTLYGDKAPPVPSKGDINKIQHLYAEWKRHYK